MSIKIFTVLVLVNTLSLINYDIAFSGNYWIKHPSPVIRNFKNCFFINNNTGWISGDSGTIIKTTNEGLTWSILPTGVYNDIQSIFFINERLGWAVSNEVFPDTNSFLGTRILKTTDGGSSWINYMYPDSNKFMRSIYFLDSLTGFMVGAPITIVRTGDAGFRWESMDTDSSLQLGLPLENIKFINDQVGYACGGFRDIAGAMWTTTNGGFNWKGLIIAPEPFMDIYIFNPAKAIAVGGDFEYGSSYVNTTNQGVHWNYDTLGTFGVATGIDFRTPSEGWIALAIAQKFTYTLDTGRTWTSIYTPDSVSVNDLQFTDSLHGWAVGYNGVVLKYNPTVSGISYEIENFSPVNITLNQNYPNPFNPKTIINYKIPPGVKGHTSNVKLVIYNSLGTEVTTLINENQKPGNYEVEFDAGIYQAEYIFINLLQA
ncbi:MAG: hypothetical protein IPL53_14035 [Ignavibacteria bacterium]|nr:hypothetical protein [Ignavibacteria bacterium]